MNRWDIIEDSLKEKIRELRNNGYGYKSIAKSVGAGKQRVKSICTWFDLIRVDKPKKEKNIKQNITKSCLFCGKEFITKNENAKYCSDSCSSKHKRRLEWNNKKCAVCGKILEYKGNKKLCSAECQAIWTKANPRHTKICLHCGKEFKTNDTQQKYCSRECANNTQSTKETRLFIKTSLNKRYHIEFLKVFNDKFGKEFEYVSGFEGSESRIVIRCKKCGELMNRLAGITRRNKKLTCNVCAKRDNLIREQETLLHKSKQQALRKLIVILKKKEIAMLKDIKKIKVCNECGKTFKANSARCVYCSDKCRRKHENHCKEVNRRYKLKDNGKIDYSISLTKLIKRDKNTCHICKGKCDSKDYCIDKEGNFIAGESYPSVDHMLPVAKGGTHTWGNVKLAHRRCNWTKSDCDCYEGNDGQIVLSI